MTELPASTHGSESTLGRSIELLHALNTAAATLQRSAHSEQEIYRAFSEQVSALALRGGLSLFDESRQNLIVHAVAQPPVFARLLARVEQITKIKTIGYAIPLAQVPVYHQVTETRKAIFVSDSSEITSQLLPLIARPFAKHILRAIGNSSVIYAPVMSNSQVMGVLNIAGINLLATDVPAIEAFANHIAIALANARLVSALRQTAEERLKFFLGIERSSEAIFLTQVNGTITYVNPAFEKMYGYTRTEAVGQTPRIIKSGVLTQDDYELFWQTLLARQVVTGELFNKTKSGNLIAVEGSASPIIDENDTVIGFLAIQHDVTERKQAEERLRQSESTYRQAIEAIGGVPYIHDVQTQIYPFMGQGIRQLTGYSPEEMTPQQWAKIVIDYFLHGEMGKLDRAELAQRTKAGEIKTWKADTRIRTRDGQIRWVLDASVLTYDETGAQRASVGILQDITERKHAEEALRASEEKFRNISEQMTDMVYVTDARGIITYASPAALTVFGFTPDEMQGSLFTRFLAESDVPKALDAFSRSVTTAMSTANLEFTMRRKDGTLFIGEINGKIIQRDGTTSTIGLVRDITQRKQRERELEAIASVSTALRSASTRDDMFPIIVGQISALLNTVGAAIGWRDSLTGESVIKYGNGNWSYATGERVPPGKGVSGKVFATKQPYMTNNLETDPLFYTRGLIGEIKGALCIPLVTDNDAVGWVFAGITSTFTEQDIRILKAIADIAAIALHRATLLEETQRVAMDLALAYDSTLEGWARALSLRDRVTQAHTQRVVDMTLVLAQAMGVTDTELIHVRRGALLHDIGKIAISDSILLKPGPLSDEEWRIMRMHPVYAREMLAPIDYLRPALDIPYCHHERWDGTGYPRGIQGNAIPLVARIFAVIDVWDAINSDRPYGKAWKPAQAREHIRAQAGKHFDPQVVAAFLKTIA